MASVREGGEKLNIFALLQRVLDSVEDLQAVVLTDSEGVLVAKAVVKDLDGSTDDLESSRMSLALDEASKLGFGHCRSLVAHYKNCVLFHLMCRIPKAKHADSDATSLVLTLVSLPTVNLARLFELEPHFNQMLNTLAQAIHSHSSSDS